MKFRSSVFPLATTLVVVFAAPLAAQVQPRATSVQRAGNARATADVRARIGVAISRIAEARRSGAITPARADTLRREMTRTQADMTRLSQQQGFVSAGELASYTDTLNKVDRELDRRGVARSYGNDMLVAPGNGDFRYDCQNDPIAIAIPGNRLDVALDQLRRTTHCPISGTELARGKRSRPVVGTMTPAAALRTMLGGTGLKGNVIKQGLQITRPRR